MQNINEILSQKKWPPSVYPQAYIEGFSHWYLPENINRINKTLKAVQKKSGGEKCLDIGFGNPIVLQRELNIYPQCSGLYITLQKALEKGVSKSIIFEGNCYPIPFHSEEFDLVSAYAFLHIIPDIPQFYKEAYRVLKKGGYLYTDGDKNIIITRILRRIKLIQYRLTGDKNKFRHWHEILNEKESFHQEGIDYKKLKALLKEIGFRNIVISPWFSAKPDYDKNLVYRIFKQVLTIFKVNFLFTHIQILAEK